MKKANDAVLAGKVAFTADARCFPAGVPSFLLFPANPVRFIQTPKEVLMIWQQNAETRPFILFFNVPHSKNLKPSWYGESVGHYENGDTLVVDTIGLSTKTMVDNYRTPHTDKLHVVERFRIIDGGKTLEDAITVEDPGTFTTPWSAVQRFRRVDQRPLEEDVCAENNLSYFGYDVAPLPQANGRTSKTRPWEKMEESHVEFLEDARARRHDARGLCLRGRVFAAGVCRRPEERNPDLHPGSEQWLGAGPPDRR